MPYWMNHENENREINNTATRVRENLRVLKFSRFTKHQEMWVLKFWRSASSTATAERKRKSSLKQITRGQVQLLHNDCVKLNGRMDGSSNEKQ